MYYAIKKTFSNYTNPVVVINDSNYVIFTNSICNTVNTELLSLPSGNLKHCNLYSVLRLKEEDKFRIRKFVKNEIISEALFLNYLEYNILLKIFKMSSGHLCFEFISKDYIGKMVESLYSDSILFDIVKGTADFVNGAGTPKKNLDSSRLVTIYNQLGIRLSECMTMDSVFFVLDNVFTEMVQPDSFDYIETDGKVLSILFSRNSVFERTEKIFENSMKWFISSVRKTRLPLVLNSLDSEISEKDYSLMPGIRSRKSVMIVPVFQGIELKSIIFLSFSEAFNPDEYFEGILFMGIANLAFITIEKIRSKEEQKNIENHFGQHEKMIGMGNIIAGVAHEINNPLSIMQLDLDDLKTRCTASTGGEETRDILDSLQEEIDRISFLVRQLKEYARPDNESVAADEKNDIVALINQYPVKILLKSLKKNLIDVTVENTAKRSMVRVPKTRIIQVLMNILTNASEALKNKTGAESKIIVSIFNDENDNIAVSVKDNGEGISDENVEKIFLPFFTTKKGDGTGLGLSISYSIVKKYGGFLYVNRNNREYTEFILKFKTIDK